MPNIVSASIETIINVSLFIEAEVKADEQLQCLLIYSHIPGACARNWTLPQNCTDGEASWPDCRC